MAFKCSCFVFEACAKGLRESPPAHKFEEVDDIAELPRGSWQLCYHHNSVIDDSDNHPTDCSVEVDPEVTI